MADFTRRNFLIGAAAGAAVVGGPELAFARKAARRFVIDLTDGSESLAYGFTTTRSPSTLGTVGGKSRRGAIQRGAVVDWNHLEALLRQAYKNGKANPRSQPLLLIDVPGASKTTRAKLAEIAFKKLGVPKLGITNAATAALRASGRTTGIVFLGTEDGSWVAPVKKGKLISRAIKTSNVGGKKLTDFLKSEVKKKGHTLTTAKARQLRDQLGEVASNYTSKVANPGSRSFKNGSQTITIGAERFRCPEVLFKPSFIGIEQEGIHKLTFKSIMKCDVDIRKDLYNNVVMSGGTTMFTGIAERMNKEIKMLAPESMTIKIIAPPERKYSVWIGGSILSSLSTFEEMWISKNEYDESGPGIVHRKAG